MRRILLTLVAVLALAGCATQPYYAHYDDGADYYYDDGGGYVPDYVSYGAYYDAMWPIYHSYYDPFYAPGFRYGVTYYPTNWFGFNSWGGGWGYPYWGYSPWRHSWYDGYYDWAYWDRHNNDYRRADRQRFGSARNEAAAVAALRRDTIPANSGRRFGDGRDAYGRGVTRDGFSSDRMGADRMSPDRTRNVGDTSMRNRRDSEGQVPTRDVRGPDRYYGEPRVQRGEGPRREAFAERSYERGERSFDRAGASFERGDRAIDRGGRDFERGPSIDRGRSFERADRSFDRGPADRSYERRAWSGGEAPTGRAGRYSESMPMSRGGPANNPDRGWRQPSPPMREASPPQFRSGPSDRGGAPAMRSGPPGGGMPMRSAPAPHMRSAPAPQSRSAPAPSRSSTGERDR